ncbi:unnamed protein product [Didymodactylos carnosus]|uniref:Uncharacterized protein n=1 Tax=Didymodactylos carnosus TaxID=1234261 RepID=A0A815STB2_9BILA|nr:unnamed protein product [Didymodactylos carnosus]CAF1496054.1 unnamed protein product [Didymodactylos carnosus]CAF3976887.1 unnamed protein product [Didymodactylos carnosus]CAF4358476.1 unnamed protein product [Didymodactylos carnosus]
MTLVRNSVLNKSTEEVEQEDVVEKNLKDVLYAAIRCDPKQNEVKWKEFQAQVKKRDAKPGDIKILIQTTDNTRHSLLHLTVLVNNLFILNRFIEDYDCDLEKAIDKHGKNVLHYAAGSLLINEGANSSSKSDPGLLEGFANFYHILPRASQCNSAIGEQQQRPKFSQTIYTDRTILTRLLEYKKFDINEGDNQGRTPLHHAVMNSCQANVEILLLDKGKINIYVNAFTQ